MLFRRCAQRESRRRRFAVRRREQIFRLSKQAFLITFS